MGFAPDHQFRTAVTTAASEIAAVLDRNPFRGTGAYPLAEVHRELAEQHAALQHAVWEYPRELAVDPEGRPDKLSTELATLLACTQYVLVLYHNLDDIPDHMRAKANRDLSATHLQARRLRDRGRRSADS